MRLFLAINLPANVRSDLLDALGPLRAAAPELGWTDVERMHLTLKFLGEQPDGAIAPLAAAMQDVARRSRRFDMRLGGVGAFPSFRRARVLWMGIAPEPRLELLHHDTEIACEQLGYPVEGRPFRPHVTLARVRDTAGVETLRALSRAAKRVRFVADAAVGSVDIMSSELHGRAGARYACLHAAPLRTN